MERTQSYKAVSSKENNKKTISTTYKWISTSVRFSIENMECLNVWMANGDTRFMRVMFRCVRMWTRIAW